MAGPDLGFDGGNLRAAAMLKMGFGLQLDSVWDWGPPPLLA